MGLQKTLQFFVLQEGKGLQKPSSFVVGGISRCVSTHCMSHVEMTSEVYRL